MFWNLICFFILKSSGTVEQPTQRWKIFLGCKTFAFSYYWSYQCTRQWISHTIVSFWLYVQSWSECRDVAPSDGIWLHLGIEILSLTTHTRPRYTQGAVFWYSNTHSGILIFQPGILVFCLENSTRKWLFPRGWIHLNGASSAGLRDLSWRLADSTGNWLLIYSNRFCWPGLGRYKWLWWWWWWWW